jgi:hypothetical protein
LRRRAKHSPNTPPENNTAKNVPPRESIAELALLTPVLMVRVVGTGAPLGVTELGEKLQAALAGIVEHENETV